jgi:hypothetical protein
MPLKQVTIFWDEYFGKWAAVVVVNNRVVENKLFTLINTARHWGRAQVGANK